ncbi:hypothetical protein Hanom_Chr09g00847341 [Helianthus anomalus]
MGLKAHIEQWTFGLYPACIKYLLTAFDVPEVMAVTRTNICKNGMASLSRGSAVIYYASVFMYFWVLSTPVVSLVFGSYLYICVNWLHLHFDEAFSSLRIANYKSFTRFHIKEDGNLEVFTLAVDKVPEKWMVDPDSVKESKQLGHQLRRRLGSPLRRLLWCRLRHLLRRGLRRPLRRRLSHQRQYPSKWRAYSFLEDPVKNVRMVDRFVIKAMKQ